MAGRATSSLPFIWGDIFRPFTICRKAKLLHTIFIPARAVWCTTTGHFHDKTVYAGENCNLKLCTQTNNGPKMVPGSEIDLVFNSMDRDYNDAR